MPRRPEIGNIQLYPKSSAHQSGQERIRAEVLLPDPPQADPEELRYT